MGEHPAVAHLKDRQERLAAGIRAAGLDGLVLNAGPSLTYLTGLHFHLSERPVVAVFKPGEPVALVLPELERGKVEGLPFEARVFLYGENPATWGQPFRQAFAFLGFETARLGVEPRRLRFLELRMLEDAVPGAQFVSGGAILAEMRAVKDASEVAAMRQAVEVAQQALQATLPHIRVGMTERELASELTWQLLRAGSQPEVPFSPIVAFGPNSANPHAFPTDRVLQQDEIVLLDWGANVGGYFSDITRTFVSGEPDPELARVAGVVVEANAAARAGAAPGVPAGEVDRLARQVISRAGYGEYFIHRTGHGLGIEGHEEPYIRGDNPTPLVPGMTFTIEPGVYLSGRGGVRVEDDVLVTDDGAESLTSLPRELIKVAG